MWNFETREHRRDFAPPNKRFYKLHGKYPVWGVWSKGESRGEKAQLGGSCPSKAGDPSPTQGTPNPNLEKFVRIYSLRDLAVHTQWAACPWLQHQWGESRKEIPALKTFRGTGRLWPALTKEDYLTFREVECTESWPVTPSCQGACHIGNFWRGDWRHGWAGNSHMAATLPAKGPNSKYSLCPLNPAGQEE